MDDEMESEGRCFGWCDLNITHMRKSLQEKRDDEAKTPITMILYRSDIRKTFELKVLD